MKKRNLVFRRHECVAQVEWVRIKKTKPLLKCDKSPEGRVVISTVPLYLSQSIKFCNLPDG